LKNTIRVIESSRDTLESKTFGYFQRTSPRLLL